MKTLIKILLLLTISLGFITDISYTQAYTNDNVDNIVTNPKSGNNDRNKQLNNFNNEGSFFNIGGGGVRGAQNTLLRVAKDLKDLFFILATIYLMIIVIKILFTNNTEEEVEKFKNGIIWTTVGIVVMQSAYAFVKVLYEKDRLGASLAFDFIDNIVNPIIGLIEVLASVFFLAIAIFSFYKMVTANGDEEKVKSGKTSIAYAIVGFILIKLAKVIVEGVYGKVNPSCESITNLIDRDPCLEKADVTGFAGTILDVLNWVNSFIGIVVVVMIIYTGSQVLLSAGDEEKLKKAKSSLIYIAIGLAILAMNYLIVTFFILPDTPIGA